jgi:hypothetical protein
MESNVITVWDFIEPVEGPPPPSISLSDEDEIPEAAVESFAKTGPKLPSRKLIAKGSPELIKLVAGLMAVKTGDKYYFNLFGENIVADGVGMMHGNLYWRIDHEVYLWTANGVTIYEIPLGSLEYKICTFLGKTRFLLRYQNYAVLLKKCEPCPVLHIPTDRNYIYSVNGVGLCSPVRKLTSKSVLLFLGSKINISSKAGRVKKKDLVIRDHTIIWRGVHYVVT